MLSVASLLSATNGADAVGRHFQALFQFQLFGLADAFLTGDLFNLFVFFEVLLIASYGLLMQGGGVARTRAALQYVVLNLIDACAGSGCCRDPWGLSMAQMNQAWFISPSLRRIQFP